MEIQTGDEGRGACGNQGAHSNHFSTSDLGI